MEVPGRSLVFGGLPEFRGRVGLEGGSAGEAGGMACREGGNLGLGRRKFGGRGWKADTKKV